MLKKIVQNILKNNVYKVRRGIARGLLRKGGAGFLPKINDLTKEMKFLLDIDLTRKTVYDIGANIGLISLYFASAVTREGKLISIEPNPSCFKKLLENIKVNDFTHVSCHQFAVGKENLKRELAFDPDHLSQGSLNKQVLINLNKKIAKKIVVDVFSLDYLIYDEKFDPPNFIKMDVEGLEYDVLLGMKIILSDFGPKLFIEIHGIDERAKIDNIKQVVQLVTEHQYNVFHVESGETIDVNNYQIAKEGHIYCSKKLV